MQVLLAQTLGDGLNALDWALTRGVQSVLALACLVLFYMIVRLYKEKNLLHKDQAKLEKAFRERVEELEADFRAKVEQLLREQVKIAKETTRTLIEATSALRSLSTWIAQSDSEEREDS